jgi:hypothetical protein
MSLARSYVASLCMQLGKLGIMVKTQGRKRIASPNSNHVLNPANLLVKYVFELQKFDMKLTI